MLQKDKNYLNFTRGKFLFLLKYVVQHVLETLINKNQKQWLCCHIPWNMAWAWPIYLITMDSWHHYMLVMSLWWAKSTSLCLAEQGRRHPENIGQWLFSLTPYKLRVSFLLCAVTYSFHNVIKEEEMTRLMAAIKPWVIQASALQSFLFQQKCATGRMQCWSCTKFGGC